jgi:hypothetical protein
MPDLGPLSRQQLASSIVFLGLCALAVVPIAFVRFLPLNDYPFHVARIFILAHIHDPTIARFYSGGSFLLPNVAMDAFALPLSEIIGAENSARLFVEVTLVVMLAGTVALHFSAHHQFSPWPFLAFSALHSGIFRFGFFNYLFGVGLALGASAIWLVLPRGLLRLGIAFVSSVILIFCHIEAFGVFAVTVAGYELHASYVSWRRAGGWRPALDLLSSASPFLLTVLFFIAFSPTAKVAARGVQYAAGLGTKPIGLVFSLSSGIDWLDAATVLSLAILFFWLHFSHRLIWSQKLLVATGLALLALAVLPSSMMGGQYVDSRLGPAVALLLLLSVDVSPAATPVFRYSVLGVAVALALLRTFALTATWSSYGEQTAAIVRAFDKLEPGATVFGVTSQSYTKLIADTPEKRLAWRPPLTHVVSYAVLGAPVFVPMTWSDPTQQPLVVRPPYQAVKTFQGTNPDVVADAVELRRYLSALNAHLIDGHWPQLGPVYVLVVGARGRNPGSNVPNFREAAEGNLFILLRWSGPQLPRLGSNRQQSH